MGVSPLFPVPVHSLFIGPAGLLSCILCGALAGFLSIVLTRAVYGAEDAFAGSG